MVLSLFEAPDVDYAQLYRDDSLWSGQAEALAPSSMQTLSASCTRSVARNATRGWMA
jgi:hypothetical protein